MNIFWRRYSNEVPPYTNDEILNNHKFTNVYRVLDRSSQYLLNNVINIISPFDGKEYSREDMFWRILLYKHLNLPSTWDYLIEKLGEVRLSTQFEDISEVLTEYQAKGNKLYSNAYMLTASFMRNDKIKKKYGILTGSKKHEAYLQIFKHGIFDIGLHIEILDSKTFGEAFEKFNSVITIGEFLAYQYTQDLNYTNFVNWDDNSFCAAGPGTIRGIERTFDIEGKPNYGVIVKWVHENFKELLVLYSEEYKINLDFKPLLNWMPTVPDLSNCFCETDKYMRGLGIETKGKEISGKRIKQVFSESKSKIEYNFPTKWGVKL
jgi:hypothetical protein